MLLYDQNNHVSWTTHHMEEHYNKTQNTPDKARRKIAAGSGAEREREIQMSEWTTD